MEQDYSPKYIKLNEESEIDQILKNMKSQVLEIMKMIRNETLDKAAKQYLTTKGKYYDTSTKVFAYNGFKAGAEWQRNNIWHDVRNIPIKGSYIVVFTKYGSITSWFASNDIESVFKRFDVVAWAYAKDISPASFDEILDENKDVLQRLKDK